jgi:hypothetical protein
MADVLRHNRLDIVSMAALTRHLSDILMENDLFSDGECSLAAARLFIDREHITEGRAILCDLSASVTSASREARRHLSLILKREKNWRQAGNIWEMMLRENPADCFACEELAKWYEHRLKDVNKALELVKATVAAIDKDNFAGRELLQHRLLRLEKRSLSAAKKKIKG